MNEDINKMLDDMTVEELNQLSDLIDKVIAEKSAQ